MSDECIDDLVREIVERDEWIDDPVREIVKRQEKNFFINVTLVVNNMVSSFYTPHAQIGIINAGSMQDVKDLNIKIGHLYNRQGENIAQAFKEIVESTLSCQSFKTESERKDLIDQVNVLAEQAVLEESRRKTGVVKMALTAIGGTCAAVGGLAEVWSTWGPSMSQYFGVPLL